MSEFTPLLRAASSTPPPSLNPISPVRALITPAEEAYILGEEEEVTLRIESTSPREGEREVEQGPTPFPENAYINSLERDKEFSVALDKMDDLVVSTLISAGYFNTKKRQKAALEAILGAHIYFNQYSPMVLEILRNVSEEVCLEISAEHQTTYLPLLPRLSEAMDAHNEQAVLNLVTMGAIRNPWTAKKELSRLCVDFPDIFQKVKGILSRNIAGNYEWGEFGEFLALCCAESAPLAFAEGMLDLALPSHLKQASGKIFLIEKGGTTTLCRAAANPDLGVLKLFREKLPSADINMSSKNGTPLHTAVLFNQLGNVAYLLTEMDKKGIRSTDSKKNTALHCALMGVDDKYSNLPSSSSRVIKAREVPINPNLIACLVENMEDGTVRAANKFGRTALHFFAKIPATEFTPALEEALQRVIVRMGPKDISREDCDGYSALDHAKITFYEHLGILALFEDAPQR